MKLLSPRTLTGQIALVMIAALLVASAVNFLIIMSERSRASLIEATGPAIARFADMASEMVEKPPEQRQLNFGRGGARFSLSARSQVEARMLPRNRRLEARLLALFEQSDADVSEVRAAITVVERPNRLRIPTTPAVDVRGPGPRREAGERARRDPDVENPRGPVRGREVALSVQLRDGRWLNASFFSPSPPRGEMLRLAASTLVTFFCVLGAALWVASRLSRPLRDLEAAASQVGAVGEPQEVKVRGPGDVRQTLEAFNTMSRRVTQLLNEKDVMLGALGHDLRTPLSSLRIRIETMEPESERLKAIQTIEEAADLLEDILVLARQGRSGETVRMMDATVLVQDLVEDYAETGAAASLGETQRTPIACRPVLFRRLLRNLIDNALAYGQTARVSVRIEAGRALISVEDEGPGMSPGMIAGAKRPFERGETSRNRASGGAGLGLAIAEAIAKAHGGELILANRPQGGLSATVSLPLGLS